MNSPMNNSLKRPRGTRTLKRMVFLIHPGAINYTGRETSLVKQENRLIRKWKREIDEFDRATALIVFTLPVYDPARKDLIDSNKEPWRLYRYARRRLKDRIVFVRMNPANPKCADRLLLALYSRGLTYDPSAVTAEGWGQSFEGCCVNYISRLGLPLGLKDPIRERVDMTFPDAGFVVESKFVEQIDLDRDTRLFLWGMKDGRSLGLYLPGTVPLHPKDYKAWKSPDHTALIQLDPGKLSFCWKTGAAIKARSSAKGLLSRTRGRIALTIDPANPLYIVTRDNGLSFREFKNTLASARIVPKERTISTGGKRHLPSVWAHGFVINDEPGKPALVCAVANRSPKKPVTVRVDVESSRGCSWKPRCCSVRKRVSPGESGIVVPLVCTGESLSGNGRLKTVASVEGIERPFTNKIDLLGIPRLRQRLRVDGKGTGWNEVQPVMLLESGRLVKTNPGMPRWGGKEDLSMKMRMGWNKSCLYLFAEVMDDKFVMNQIPDPRSPVCCWYAADCVEVFLDASNRASHDRCYSDAGRYHLQLVAGTMEGPRAKWRIANGEHVLDGVCIASSFRTNGYNIEMSIPWRNFLDLLPIPGCVIRMAVTVNDRDDPEGTVWARKQLMSWARRFDASRNSLNYASVVLLP